MAKYRKRPVIIEAITFNELIEYGKNNGANIINGMPWSFNYMGHPITHENDQCYLIPTLEGTMRFTPEDMLITGVNGEIYPCKKDIFKKIYELAQVKRTINIRFAEGEQVILKTDPLNKRVVNGYMLRGKHITYGVALGENETWHQECELEIVPEKKKAGFVK